MNQMQLLLTAVSFRQSHQCFADEKSIFINRSVLQSVQLTPL